LSPVTDFLTATNVIRACWLIFAIVWLLAAISTKPTIYRESSVSRLRYTILLIVAWLLLSRARRMSYPFDLQVIPQTDTVEWMCAILCIAGLAFCCWARLTIGRNWSGIVTLKEGHDLITRGPYALVRHPIYTGLLVMFAATALAYGYLAGVFGIVLVFVSFWIKLSDEEKVMLKQFPEQYAAYRKRVKRIIPFVV
jgi:protein-S-isoprenylcysteine O-methyltransferase Ste14